MPPFSVLCEWRMVRSVSTAKTMSGQDYDPRPAQVSERIGAFIVNIFLGALPIAVPTIAQSQVVEPWLKSESVWSVLAVTLALFQYIGVYKLRGSPGYIVAGLRVQLSAKEGSMHKAAIIRASPFLFLIGILMILPQMANNPLLMGATAILLLMTFLFLAASGIVLVFDGRRSLIDRMSDTEVVKIYSVFPRK